MAQKGKGSTVIHEVNESQHRIVVLKMDGTSDVGNWVELRQVAHNGQMFAICGESPLPQGVFTCRDVAHQVI